MFGTIFKCFCITDSKVTDMSQVIKTKYTMESVDSKESTSSVFSDYNINREVGKGTYGDVWVCDEKGTKKKVAIKFSTSGSSKKYLKKEYDILGMFDNDCIITPITFYTGVDTSQMVLPYYKKDIYDYAENKQRITDDAIKMIAYRVARAIEHAHSKNIVHRDIKPENIMYNKSLDDCVLIDWGLSDHEDHINIHKITGSYGYMAPEVVIAHYNPEAYTFLVGKASDMYSIGATLYALAAKEQVIYIDRGESMKKIITNDMTERINNLDRSDSFKSLLHGLLCLDPISRLTINEMLSHEYFK